MKATATVTREGAQRIVEERTGAAVREVVALEELAVRPPNLYGVPVDRCWIAFLEQPGTGIRSSRVALVDRQTGAIRYHGPARDEG